ncbi:hypothetical protein JOD01_000676 [Brevibacillus fulvus]|uniref:Uncharacterized protein n=1 Tax=Brevibacillus fulvus TaxID=1125967 RepID=A0A938Y0W1_9BACL|nr:hypothetical protein [Brevibacillus fulvus]
MMQVWIVIVGLFLLLFFGSLMIVWEKGQEQKPPRFPVK